MTATPTPTTRQPASPAPGRSRGVRIVRAILTCIWLLGVPAFAGAYVDQQFGEKLVAKLGAEAALAAALTAALIAFAAAWSLYRRHLITLFALVPALVSWIGYVGFGGG